MVFISTCSNTIFEDSAFLFFPFFYPTWPIGWLTAFAEIERFQSRSQFQAVWRKALV